MAKLNATDSLQLSIQELELKRDVELIALKEQLHIIHENLKPVNLFKSVLKEMSEGPDLRNSLGKAAMGMVTGYAVKNLIVRSSKNPIRNVLGTAAQSIVSNLTANNTDKLINLSKFLYSKLWHKNGHDKAASN